MGNLFLLYLRASLWGSIFTVVVYMINRLFKQKMPPSWHYYIWIPVVFCFLLPVTIQVPAPAFIVEQNEISSSQNTFEEQTAPIPLPEITETSKPNTAVRQPQPVFQNTPEAESRPNSTIPPSAVAAFIWAVVATGLLCKLFFAYYVHQRKIKRNCIPATGPILDKFNDLCRKKCIGSKITLAIGPNISSPFTTGIISPGIILPDRPYTGNQLEMILQHELVHVKRHDVFIKLLAEIVRAFHWFNPLAHFSAKQIDFQCETACDAAVLYNSTQDERILYGLTILECASQAINKNTPLALSLGQNKQFLKNRINHIVNGPPLKRNIPLAVLLTTFVLIFWASSGLKTIAKPLQNTVPPESNITITETLRETIRVPQKTNVLIVGIDSFNQITDVIMVASLDTKNNQLSLFSISRDTYLEPEDDFWQTAPEHSGTKSIKINEVTQYANSFEENGLLCLKQEVENLFALPIDYTIQVNMAAFENMINAVGGIEMEVAQDMVYADPVQNLEINIQKGYQTLDGETALHFVRYRNYLDGDLGRIGVQQQFLQSVFKQLLADDTFFEMLPTYISTLIQETETDIPLTNAIAYIPAVKKLSSGNFVTLQIPGTYEYQDYKNYFIPDMDIFNETIGPLFR